MPTPLEKNFGGCSLKTNANLQSFTMRHSGSKKLANFLLPQLYQILTNLRNCFTVNHEKICNNAITKDLTTPKVCCYTTL